MQHIPVLLKEAIEYLDPKPGENFIDATLGAGGHASAILEKIAPGGKLLAIDASIQAIENFSKKLKDSKISERLIFTNDNFSHLQDIIAKCKFVEIQGILADLGFSSVQLEASGRGFSFLRNEPLLMTFDENQEFTAKDLINQYPEEALEKIFKEYGEEKFSKQIASLIIKERKARPIKTTFQLTEIIKKATPFWYHRGRLHPSTKVFQALRIAVNDELGNLEKFLPQALEIMEKGGRLAIISFHSLEDRIVKNFLKEKQRINLIKILTKKAVRPSALEIQGNSRSRSAKLRAAQKL